MTRHDALARFYSLLTRLEAEVGGARRLKNCDGYMDWPDRGVYFFFAPGELRASSDQRRVTRVGTHAVSTGSGTTLWDRLKQHYGTGSGSSNHPHGGNQRGSVFRREVGRAFIQRHDLYDQYPDWDLRRLTTADRNRGTVRDEEYPMERRVSAYIRDLPFLWVNVDDNPGPNSDRAFIERNAIALLSNYGKPEIDPRAECWLGRESPQQPIRESGLWNSNHVEDEYDPTFLEMLEERITTTNPI